MSGLKNVSLKYVRLKNVRAPSWRRSMSELTGIFVHRIYDINVLTTKVRFVAAQELER